MTRTNSILLSIIFSALALSSCGGNAGVEENISASPSSIGFKSTSGQQTISVEADCAWTATVSYSGSDATEWLILGKTKGTGNASVVARALENKFKEPRTATITFTTAGGKTVGVSVSQEENSAGDDKKSFKARIGSYNIRMSNLDSGDNAWAVRKDRLWKSIRQCDFDIFGVQEVSTTAQNDLKSEFSSTYGMYFFSPYAQNGSGDKAHGVLYRSSKFTASDFHNFWMGPDPATMSKSDTGTQGDFNRGGFCCTFTHKETGVKLFFMCTHGCLNTEPNAKYAPIYEKMERQYNTQGLPSIFVGDMNASPDSETTTIFKTYWKDAYVELPSTAKSGPAYTYNAYTSVTGKSRIDYVYYRGAVTPEAYCCDNTLFGNLYPSDHFPVHIDCTISL